MTNIKRCAAHKVKKGDFFSLYGFGTVEKVGSRMIGVRNHTGFTYDVAREVLENEYSFASQSIGETVKLARTKLIQILKDNPRTAMTVVFTKKADPNVLADALVEGQGGMTQRAWRKKVKQFAAGEKRTIVGHHQNSFDEHGRLRFEAHDVGLRLIDPRTITSLTVNQATFEVK